MLMPFQGVLFTFITQGGALGYALNALSGRTCYFNYI